MFLFLFQSLSAQQNTKPRLVVGIVVDQMRAEYLQRFAPKFGEDGFNRLTKEGFVFDEMHYNYVPTYTGPGHASIYTGTTPATHGIVGNHWVDAGNRKIVYCVDDEKAAGLGTTGKAGRKSPHHLFAPTLGDQMKLESNFRSKVVSVSLKDRAAILPGGFSADWAFWLEKESGKMISSNYYGKKLPEWVDKFNRGNRAAAYLSKTWKPLLPIEEYTESREDDSPYEQLFPGEKKAVFPHDLPAIQKEMGLELLYHTPFGNDFLTDFAKTAIEGEGLGSREDQTDILMISYSSTDVIGHHYGPRSVEVEDTYLRLDRNIAGLLQYLDNKYGQDSYLLFLTSDHGVAENPAYLQEHKIKAGFFDTEDLLDKLKGKLFDAFHDSLAIAFYNQQLYFNPLTLPKKEKDKKEIYRIAAEYLRTLPGVADVYTEFELRECGLGNSFCPDLARGLYPPRSGEVTVLLRPDWIIHDPRGTTHGSPYKYDTHVPFLLYGWQIPAGHEAHEVQIVDLAPSIADLLGIEPPSGSTGRSLVPFIR